MRLSEAILLGSLYLKPVAWIRHDGCGSGCALGMAEIAGGVKQFRAETKWPFLKDIVSAYPCGCEFDEWLRKNATTSSAIAHIFNMHVYIDKTWTLEQLSQWVATIEPPELPANAAVTGEREAEAVGSQKGAQ